MTFFLTAEQVVEVMYDVEEGSEYVLKELQSKSKYLVELRAESQHFHSTATTLCLNTKSTSLFNHFSFLNIYSKIMLLCI